MTDNSWDQLPAAAKPDAAQLLRRIADLLDTGVAVHAVDPTPGALLDADVAGRRYLLFEQPATAVSLSPREQEIVRMVARGLTNRGIGTALDISLWTVSTHLRRIFAKLGVNSRAEMVAMTMPAPHKPALR